MLLNFRQGVIRPAYKGFAVDDPTIPSYISRFNNSIRLTASESDPIIITFAYYDQDILYKETENIIALTSVPPVTPAWIYWDISLEDGRRTFGGSFLEPVVSSVLPQNPIIGQHVFLTTDRVMKLWVGDQWINTLRVFIGKYDGSVSIPITEPFFVNKSQVGLDTPCKSGYLLFDEHNMPMKSGNRLLTTESVLKTQNNFYTNVDLPAKKLHARAIHQIHQYKCITYKNKNNDIGITTSNDPNNPCTGIAVEPFTKGAIQKYITTGYINDPTRFNWVGQPNTLLFVSPQGDITTTPPTSVSIQRIGYVVDRFTVYIDIKEKILIDIVIRPAYVADLECPTEYVADLECPIL